MKLYLLDANVLITAHNTYYPTNRIPEFWAWVHHHATAGRLKMPKVIFDEVKGGTGNADKDLLFAWIQKADIKKSLVLNETADQALLAKVLADGYSQGGAPLNDVEIDTIGKDPLLIAHGLMAPERVVVSDEVSAPSKKRANRKVPDICAMFNAPCCNAFGLVRGLDFKTSWTE